MRKNGVSGADGDRVIALAGNAKANMWLSYLVSALSGTISDKDFEIIADVTGQPTERLTSS